MVLWCKSETLFGVPLTIELIYDSLPGTKDRALTGAITVEFDKFFEPMPVKVFIRGRMAILRVDTQEVCGRCEFVLAANQASCRLPNLHITNRADCATLVGFELSLTMDDVEITRAHGMTPEIASKKVNGGEYGKDKDENIVIKVLAPGDKPNAAWSTIVRRHFLELQADAFDSVFTIQSNGKDAGDMPVYVVENFTPQVVYAFLLFCRGGRPEPDCTHATCVVDWWIKLARFAAACKAGDFMKYCEDELSREISPTTIHKLVNFVDAFSKMNVEIPVLAANVYSFYAIHRDTVDKFAGSESTPLDVGDAIVRDFYDLH